MDSNVLFIRTCLLGVAGFVIMPPQLQFLKSDTLRSRNPLLLTCLLWKANSIGNTRPVCVPTPSALVSVTHIATQIIIPIPTWPKLR